MGPMWIPMCLFTQYWKKNTKKTYTVLAIGKCNDEGNKLASDNNVLKNETGDAAHCIINFNHLQQAIKGEMVYKLYMEERDKNIIKIVLITMDKKESFMSKRGIWALQQ
eukprot:15319928-Ditylum_brightwellii.AAC.2